MPVDVILNTISHKKVTHQYCNNSHCIQKCCYFYITIYDRIDFVNRNDKKKSTVCTLLNSKMLHQHSSEWQGLTQFKDSYLWMGPKRIGGDLISEMSYR